MYGGRRCGASLRFRFSTIVIVSRIFAYASPWDTPGAVVEPLPAPPPSHPLPNIPRSFHPTAATKDEQLLGRLAGAPRLKSLCLHGSGSAGRLHGFAKELTHCEELEWLVEGGGRDIKGDDNDPPTDVWDPSALLGRLPHLQRLDLRVYGATMADRDALARSLRVGFLETVRELHVMIEGGGNPASPTDPPSDPLTPSLCGCPRLEHVTLALTQPSGEERSVIAELVGTNRCPVLRSARLAEYVDAKRTNVHLMKYEMSP